MGVIGVSAVLDGLDSANDKGDHRDHFAMLTMTAYGTATLTRLNNKYDTRHARTSAHCGRCSLSTGWNPPFLGYVP